LKFTAAAPGAMFALRISIFPWDVLRGVRRTEVFCAKAVMPSVMVIAEAMTRHETPRLLEALQIIF
jgi:hypothetical protein